MEKIAIVTGASRGIGKEIAIQLAKNGVKVIANYNKSENQAKELKQELEKINIKIDIFENNENTMQIHFPRKNRIAWYLRSMISCGSCRTENRGTASAKELY